MTEGTIGITDGASLDDGKKVDAGEDRMCGASGNRAATVLEYNCSPPDPCASVPTTCEGTDNAGLIVQTSKFLTGRHAKLLRNGVRAILSFTLPFSTSGHWVKGSPLAPTAQVI